MERGRGMERGSESLGELENLWEHSPTFTVTLKCCITTKNFFKTHGILAVVKIVCKNDNRFSSYMQMCLDIKRAVNH